MWVYPGQLQRVHLEGLVGEISPPHPRPGHGQCTEVSEGDYSKELRTLWTACSIPSSGLRPETPVSGDFRKVFLRCLSGNLPLGRDGDLEDTCLQPNAVLKLFFPVPVP